jgi:hypothetical protein
VRIRIALSTAMAVIFTAAAFLTLLSGSPSASAAHQSVTGPSASKLAFYTVPAEGPLVSKLAFSVPPAAAPTPAPTPTIAPLAPAAAPAVVPAVAPVVVAAAPVAVSDSDSTSVDTADWMCIRVHESGDRYNDPSAPSGAYGILISTWHDFGYSGWPYQAAPAVQDALALRLHQMYGFHPWSSRYACGL